MTPGSHEPAGSEVAPTYSTAPGPGPTSKRLLPAGATALAGFGLIAALPDPVAAYPWMMVGAGISTVGWVWGWAAVARGLAGESAGSGRRPTVPPLAVILAVAVVARLLLLAPATPLSDDLYRYLWDGRVANAGIHPFAHAPEDEELAALRDDEIWPRVNHPHVPTIYPPVAQLLFRAVDGMMPTALGVRVTIAALDLATTALLALLLVACGRSPSLAIVHAWCPLAVMESAGGGHVDPLGVMLLVAAVLLWERRAKLGALAAGVLAGLSTLVKPVGLLVVPALLRFGRGSRRWQAVAGGLLAMTLVIPYVSAGVDLFAGFRTYATEWRFNDVFFSFLFAAGVSADSARLLLGVVLAVVVLAVPFRVRRVPAAAGCVAGAFLLLSPTVYPWYALWLVPWIAFLPRPTVGPAVLLVVLLPVSYATAWMRSQTGVWEEVSWAKAVVWGPVLATLARAAMGRLAARRMG